MELCKTFCGIKQKSLQPDYLKNHKTHKAFYKDYRRKLYIYLELGEDDKSDSKLPKKLFKVSQSDSGSGCKITISAHTPDMGDKKKIFLLPVMNQRFRLIMTHLTMLQRIQRPLKNVQLILILISTQRNSGRICITLMEIIPASSDI